jgi:carbonic anhydrase/acetyltransferase-like protein (isoleucine patch superfamily)
VHIGHDTDVGRNCLFAGQVGIAGACVIEDGVTLWGQVGVSKTLTIGENVTVYAQSGVPFSLEGNKVYFGSPVVDAKEKKKEAGMDQAHTGDLGEAARVDGEKILSNLLHDQIHPMFNSEYSECSILMFNCQCSIELHTNTEYLGH